MGDIFEFCYFPNFVTIFTLKFKTAINLYNREKKNLILALFPVYKNHWINARLKLYKGQIFLDYDKNSIYEPISINDFTNIKRKPYEEYASYYTIEVNEQEYLIDCNAYALLKLKLKYKNKIFNIFELPRDIARGIIYDGCYYNYLSIFGKEYYSDPERNYFFKFKPVSLKSLLIENQKEILKIFLNRDNFVLTGGTGVGKTSQIPKLLWWFTVWFDGYIFFDKPISLDKPLANIDFNFDPVINNTVLSLPKKILISENGRNIAKSLGFPNIEGSIVECIYKNIYKERELVNNNPLLKCKLVISVNALTLVNSTNANCFILDEIHEQDTFALIVVSILYKKFKNVRNICLMTATLEDDKQRIIDYFKDIKFINIPGDSLFPVEVKYISNLKSVRSYYDVIIKLIREKLFNINDSIIIFKSTKKEIDDYYIKLKALLPDINFVKAYSDIPDLKNIIRANENNKKRNIFLGTNILESSLTIESAAIVIDDCYFYMKHFRTGRITEITKSMQIQRMGRVGRVRKGIYIGRKEIKETTILKLDHIYLWDYIMFAAKYNMKFDDFIIKPSNMLRFHKSINYLYRKGIDVKKDIDVHFKNYCKYNCSLIEYLKLYKILFRENIKEELSLFDEMNDIKYLSNHMKYLIIKELNLRLEIVKIEENFIYFRLVDEIEDIEHNFIKAFFDKKYLRNDNFLANSMIIERL